jgi:hypothetical protein
MSSDDRANSSNKTVIIVVSIVGIVVLLVIVACGGLAYMAIQGFSQAVSTMMQQFGDIQASMELAQSFVNDLSAGQVDEAYDRTSKGFQGRLSREQFKALVDKYPQFQNSTNVLNPPNNMAPGMTAATFTATVSGTKGSVLITVHVLKEGEQWKVDRFTPAAADDAKVDAGAAEKVARKFLKDLADGKVAEAYAGTTQDYQDKTTVDELRGLVAKQPNFQKATKQSFKTVNQTPEQAVFTATVSSPRGSVTCTVRLSHDEAGWKVDGFSVP